MISYEIGIIVLLVCVVVSRIISVKAAKSMSKEKKAEMIDKFSGFAAYGMIPYVVIIAAYFLVAKYTEMDKIMLTWLYFGLLILMIIATQIYSIKKLREMDLDSGYMRKYTIARVISMTGFAIFMVAVLPI